MAASITLFNVTTHSLGTAGGEITQNPPLLGRNRTAPRRHVGIAVGPNDVRHLHGGRVCRVGLGGWGVLIEWTLGREQSSN